MIWAFVSVAAAIGVLAGLLVWHIRRRHMQRWLPAYLREMSRRRAPATGEEIHLLLCFADHFEPRAGGVDRRQALRRVETWTHAFPERFGSFRDSDGRPPRYTFFFPIEEYAPEYLDLLAELCHAGFAEVEVHLHHNGDTADNLHRRLLDFKEMLAGRHRLLSRRKDTGEISYGFIHGNWTLCNALSGRTSVETAWCGVDNELDILLQTGCYADFTYPSAPHVTQPPIINSLYYACDQPGRPRSHEIGWPVGSSAPPPNSLLLVQGPLLLDWRRRKMGILPATENGCLQASQPPDIARLPAWLGARVQVPSRPDWFFVKLHAHGAEENAHEVLLGAPMMRLHKDLAGLAHENAHFHFHYVTAREVYNLIKAAEAGFGGPVHEVLDHLLVSNVQESGDRRQESGVRGQESAVRSQESAVREGRS
jgi:hypothetical protein